MRPDYRRLTPCAIVDTLREAVRHENTTARNSDLFREISLGLIVGVGLGLLFDSALLVLLGKAALVFFPAAAWLA